MKKKTLEWGETPWDQMSRDELLLEVKRMYSATRSLYSVVKSDSIMSNNPYYGKSRIAGKRS